MKDLGLVEIYYGDGKGKTTAAVGLSCRAIGQGLKVLFVQFLKGRPTGELKSLEALGIDVKRAEGSTKFTFEMNEEELKQCKERQQKLFDEAKEKSEDYDLVVLDEVLDTISTNLIKEDEILEFLKIKPKNTEIVLTGHEVSEKVKAKADYISNIKGEKHPYSKGVSARIGIEF